MGGRFFIENSRRGGGLPGGWGREGEGPGGFAGNLVGGGGAKYFFPGPKCPPSFSVPKAKTKKRTWEHKVRTT